MVNSVEEPIRLIEALGRERVLLGFPGAGDLWANGVVHSQVIHRMDAWLNTLAALVSPIANALYLAGGNNYRLAHTYDRLVLTVHAIKEGLQVLKALQIPITPVKYRAILWMPEPLLVAARKTPMAPHKPS